MYNRNLAEKIAVALTDTPVVLLNGARQTGKSTLAENLNKDHTQYFNFDDSNTLSIAQTDPHGFIQRLEGNVILDEIHSSTMKNVNFARKQWPDGHVLALLRNYFSSKFLCIHLPALLRNYFILGVRSLCSIAEELLGTHRSAGT